MRIQNGGLHAQLVGPTLKLARQNAALGSIQVTSALLETKLQLNQGPRRNRLLTYHERDLEPGTGTKAVHVDNFAIL